MPYHSLNKEHNMCNVHVHPVQSPGVPPSWLVFPSKPNPTTNTVTDLP